MAREKTCALDCKCRKDDTQDVEQALLIDGLRESLAQAQTEIGALREVLSDIAAGECCAAFVNGCPRHKLAGDRRSSCAISKAKNALTQPAPEKP